MTPPADPAYLIIDIETVPDGVLLSKVAYPGQSLDPVAAVEQARRDALQKSNGKSDFIATNFCFPVAVCVARVAADFSLQAITCLDSPTYRPDEMVADFWRGLARYRSTLVSFNGRGFDLPVLEMAAFRWGISAPEHFLEKFGRRHRYAEGHLDLADWMSNHGAVPMTGGLNLLSKLLGKPGKMSTTGADVWNMYREGRIRDINDYCMYDVLDTYFVFLRTRVMTGELRLEDEQDRVEKAHGWIKSQLAKHPHLQQYLDNWGDWEPWI